MSENSLKETELTDRELLLKSKLFRDIDKSSLTDGVKKIVVDCSASGLPAAIMQRNVETLWGMTLPESDIEKIVTDNHDLILVRRAEIAQEIKDMGYVSMAADVIDQLKQAADTTSNPKELSMILNTLKGYLEMFIGKDQIKGNVTNITQINVAAESHVNDYNTMLMLQNEGCIKITNERRLKKLFGVPIEDIEISVQVEPHA